MPAASNASMPPSSAWSWACIRCGAASATPRLEKPVAAVEKAVKGLLFDCQMCGQCVLSATGMSCPMNCPKQIAQRPLRRRARQRQLRGQARDALRLGRRLARQPAHARRAAGDPRRAMRRSTAGCRAARPGSRWRGKRPRDLRPWSRPRHELRRRAGPRLSAADPARPRLAGPPRARAARRRVRRHRRTRSARFGRSDRGLPARARLRRLSSTPSTPPTAAAPTATCRAWPSARC